MAVALAGAALGLLGAGTAVAAPPAAAARSSVDVEAQGTWISLGLYRIFEQCAGQGRIYVGQGWYRSYTCVPSGYDYWAWELLVLD